MKVLIKMEKWEEAAKLAEEVRCFASNSIGFRGF